MSLWYCYIDNGKPVVRRWILNDIGKRIKLERLPTSQYKHLNEQQLKEFINRLNYDVLKKKRTIEVCKFRSSFINETLIENYSKHLILSTPTKSKATTELHYLKIHFLNFMVKLGKENPNEWNNVDEWAEYLLSLDLAPDTLRQIIRSANHFIQYLNKKRPKEVNNFILKPINQYQFKKIEANRKLNEQVEGKYIPEEHWIKIVQILPIELIPLCYLAKYYGLRRSESLGVRLDDIKYDGLDISRQLINTLPTYGPLKGREARTIPHWLSTPERCYKWINEIKLIRPDRVTELWTRTMNKLDMKYRFHDLRHTFCTNVWSVQGLLPRDIQIACGHKNIATTMKYSHIIKKTQRKVWKPDELHISD